MNDGLDVAMNQAVGVGMVEGGGHLAHETDGLVDRELPLPDQALPQGLPDVRHGLLDENTELESALTTPA